MKKILVIEDEIPVLDNIVELLESEGYEVEAAKNGKEGIKKAAKLLPDLIVCDIMMPKIDGFGVIKAVHQAPKTSMTPFIFLTARSERSDIRRGMELGADDFLTKPFLPSELFQAVKTRFNKKEKIEEVSDKKLKELTVNLATTLPHELRTPLNGILSSSQFLIQYYDTLASSEIHQMHETIFASAKRLHRLIINNLFYSELELTLADKERSEHLRQCVTGVLAKEIMECFIDVADKKNRSKDMSFDLVNGRIKVNSQHYSKICCELADNALKFSDKGSVVSVSSVIRNGYYILSVESVGRAMTSEQIKKIGAYMQFDRKIFEQQGSGLGLIILKRLSQLYNGHLEIESDKDNNKTIIRISFPIETID